MQIRSLLRESCGTEVRSAFAFTELLRLTPEQQSFVIRFVIASGSLKEMAQVLGAIYPTVRSRLDRIIEVLQGERPSQSERRAAILDAVDEKRISPEWAAGLVDSLDGEERDPNT
jgi:hypothetical protein